MDKGKGRTSGADDEGFIGVKRKKSGGTSHSPKDDSFLVVRIMLRHHVTIKSHQAIKEDKLVLVDDDGNPQEKVDYPGHTGSEDEVKQVDNETTNYMASKSMGVGYDTKSLLEQWKKTGVDDDYDSYDDDMYEGHEIPENIQTICDNLDIKVRGRKKKYIIFDVILSNL
ncbi:hypothetical protein Tco_0556626 [Tanacetum coccineum]